MYYPVDYASDALQSMLDSQVGLQIVLVNGEKLTFTGEGASAYVGGAQVDAYNEFHHPFTAPAVRPLTM